MEFRKRPAPYCKWWDLSSRAKVVNENGLYSVLQAVQGPAGADWTEMSSMWFKWCRCDPAVIWCLSLEAAVASKATKSVAD